MVNSRLSELASGDRSRGQLILIGGITVALTLIGLVVILNSTIYTQNVSPGNAMEDTTDLREYEHTVENDLERLVLQMHDAEGHVAKSSFTTSLNFYSDRMAEQTANRKPGTMQVALDSTSSTTSAWIRDEGGDHFDDSHNNNAWTLVEDADNVETFDMEVTPQDLGQSFTVIVEGSSGGQWSLDVVKISNEDMDVRVKYSNRPDITCSADSDVSLDIVAGKVDEGDCFDFIPGLDGPYTIKFSDANHVKGTYSLVASGDAKEENLYDNADAGSPYLSEKMERIAVDLHYETPEFSGTVPIEIVVEEVIADS